MVATEESELQRSPCPPVTPAKFLPQPPSATTPTKCADGLGGKCKGCRKPLTSSPETTPEVEALTGGRGRSKDHCPECAARRRAILAKAGELTEWFTKLQDADPDAYSELISDHADNVDLGRGKRSSWTLAKFKDRTETSRGERTNSSRTAVDFNAYQSIFTDPRLGKDQMSKQQCKQAWLRGLGDAKKEPFKKQVWVEKLGKYEVREHLWIEMPAVMGGSLTKDKYEDTAKKKIADTIEQVNNPSAPQIRDLRQRVLSFVSHDPSAEWFMPLSCTAFLDDEVVFDEGRGQGKQKKFPRTGKDGDGAVQKPATKAKKNKNVDIFLLKTKHSTKVLASVKLTKTALYDAVAKVKFLRQEQAKLYEKIASFLENDQGFEDMMDTSPDDADLPFLRCLFMVERRVKIVESILPPDNGSSVDVEKATANTKALLEKDEYLQEEAKDARPLVVFEKPESLFQSASTAADCEDTMKSVLLSLQAAKLCSKSLRKSCDDLGKLKKSLDKARAAFAAKKLAAEKVTAEQGGQAATGRTSWSKLLTDADLPIVQGGRTLLTTRPMKVVSAAEAKDSEFYPGVDGPLLFRRGRHLMRTLCKNEAHRNIMAATVDQFTAQLTILQEANDKKESTQTRKVAEVTKAEASDACRGELLAQLLPDMQEHNLMGTVERVLSTADELSDDVKQAGLASLTNLFLSGDLAHSTTYGPDCAGVSTVRAVVHGGKLLIAVDALQLLSFYQMSSIQSAISKLINMKSADIPDAFALPSLCVAYLKTGDVLYMPPGFVSIEKTLSEHSVVLRTHTMIVSEESGGSFLEMCKQQANLKPIMAVASVVIRSSGASEACDAPDHNGSNHDDDDDDENEDPEDELSKECAEFEDALNARIATEAGAHPSMSSSMPMEVEIEAEPPKSRVQEGASAMPHAPEGDKGDNSEAPTEPPAAREAPEGEVNGQEKSVVNPAMPESEAKKTKDGPKEPEVPEPSEIIEAEVKKQEEPEVLEPSESIEVEVKKQEEPEVLEPSEIIEAEVKKPEEPAVPEPSESIEVEMEKPEDSLVDLTPPEAPDRDATEPEEKESMVEAPKSTAQNGEGQSDAGPAAAAVHGMSSTETPAEVPYKVMHCILQKGYYEEIEAGRKCIEFRSASEHWQKRVDGATHVVFAKGCTQTKLPPLKILLVERVDLRRAQELGAPNDPSLFKGFTTLLAIHFEPHQEQTEQQTLEQALEEEMDRVAAADVDPGADLSSRKRAVDDDKVVAGTKKLRVLESKPSDSGAQEQRAKKARK